MAKKSVWQEAHEIAYREGYRDALEEAIRLVRERLGDRVVNNQWQPGSPVSTEMVLELKQRRPY